ncbi:hypothetical protein DXG01_005534 [Tephrocybe rancida]|nr:hypothetical protein DXG01_005534 [Tephrocybe rancida]
MGSLVTVGALVVAMVKMRRGQSHSFNKWLRVRVAAQGLTIVALCAGTWSMRPTDPLAMSTSSTTDTNDPTLTRNDVDVERRRLEKAAREKNEFEERLRGAEQAHEAELGMRANTGVKKGPASVSEVGDVPATGRGWNAWLPWGRSSPKPTKTASGTTEETKSKS